jgi:hypothetical protein
LTDTRHPIAPAVRRQTIADALHRTAQRDASGGYARRSDITEFARLFSVILLLEVVSLMGNYY